MNNIPIFDSLAHPTINGNWILPKYIRMSGIKQLLAQMDENNIIKAMAVGMKGIGGYKEEDYIKMLKPYSEKLIPLAYFDLDKKLESKEIIPRIKKIKTIGYKGIKLHPRISDFSIQNVLLPQIIKEANELKLNVLFCTCFFSDSKNTCSNSVSQLANVLYKINDAKIILMHGGTVQLMEILEIARAFKNILVDLSYTLCRYVGSSVDLDINYAFNKFDKRICVGSDFPEISLFEMRTRFDFFSKNTTTEKAENIAYKNISKFLY
jgi:predicted TIM-barrel fold metal-dependent hydrolase